LDSPKSLIRNGARKKQRLAVEEDEAEGQEQDQQQQVFVAAGITGAGRGGRAAAQPDLGGHAHLTSLRG